MTSSCNVENAQLQFGSPRRTPPSFRCRLILWEPLG